MDGDESPLDELVLLSETYGFTLIVDEAHSTGSYGGKWKRIAVQKKTGNKIAIRIYTFVRRWASMGACCGGR